MQAVIVLILRTISNFGKLLFEKAIFTFSNSSVSLGALFLSLGFIVIIMSVFWKGGHK